MCLSSFHSINISQITFSDNILKKFPPLTKMIYKRERVNWSVSISISVSPWINEIYALFERRALLERRPVKGEIWKKLACSSNFLFFLSLYNEFTGIDLNTVLSFNIIKEEFSRHPANTIVISKTCHKHYILQNIDLCRKTV